MEPLKYLRQGEMIGVLHNEAGKSSGIRLHQLCKGLEMLIHSGEIILS